MNREQLRDAADRRLARALEETGARDPRDPYRDLLREIRARDEAAFRRALDHFETRLVPAVAAEGSDPLAEWTEYGRLLAQLTSDGETVQVDPSGKAHPYAAPAPPDHLVLHLPTNVREPALAVALPARLSPAQSATYDLLVQRSTG